MTFSFDSLIFFALGLTVAGAAVAVRHIRRRALEVTAPRPVEEILAELAQGLSGVTGGAFFQSFVEQLGTQLKTDYAFVSEIVDSERGMARTIACYALGTTDKAFEYTLAGTPCANVLEGGFCIYPDRVAELFPEDHFLVEMGARSYIGAPLRASDGQILGLMAVLHSAPLSEGEGLEAIFRIFAVRAAAELERKRSEEEVRRLNAELEMRVEERTTELALVNASLKLEIDHHRQAKDEISWLNDDLQHQKEALELANHELEAFSYSVSHDLRAPLRHAKGFTQAFIEDFGAGIPPGGREHLDRVLSSCVKMEALIDDLLKLARVSRGVIHCRRVDLSALVREIAQDIRLSRPGRQVELRVAASVPAYGDEHLLRIALENLIGNAWKYTGRRDDAVVEFGVIEEGERIFFVRDNGVGFSMAHAHKLFGAFQRLHNQNEFDGTGIGLATVQRIVHRHGGRIWAEAEPGVGATFFFTL